MREFHCGENKTCQNGLQKTSYGQETLDKAFLILYICCLKLRKECNLLEVSVG